MRARWLSALGLIVACARQPSLPEPVAATTAPRSPSPSVAALANAADPSGIEPGALAQASTLTEERSAERGPPPQGLCEVELSGGFLGPAPPSGSEFIVYVAAGDCLQAGRVLQRANARSGPRFFAEVFVPCGTSLSVCASIEPLASAAPAPTSTYAAAQGTFLAVGQGEIEFKGIQLAPVAGPQRTFAAAAPPAL